MSDVSKRPNILIVLTDQQRFPTLYEPEGLRQWRRDEFVAERSLDETGVSFTRNYAMATACAPSRASLLTGQYPPLHGVTQTDGLGKSFDSPDMFWLAADTVPTIGDWFRAGGYRTFFKGKWHASHAALEDRSGEDFCSRSTMKATESRRTSPHIWMPTSWTSSASLSGWGPSRTVWASTTPER
jgi:arylsulfatase A-like enzyme